MSGLTVCGFRLFGFTIAPVLLAALLGLASTARAQDAQKEPSAPPTAQPTRPADQMPACPVRIVGAHFTPRHNPQPLLDPRNMQARRVFGTVRIEYENMSPVRMRDVEVGVHFTGQPGMKPAVPETLDPNAEYLTLPGALPGQKRSTVQPVTIEAGTLLNIQPTGATFTDGTTWQAPDSGTNVIPEGQCSWVAPGALRPAHPEPVAVR